MTDEEYIQQLQEAAQAEHRKSMRRYKERWIFLLAFASGILAQLLLRLVERFL